MQPITAHAVKLKASVGKIFTLHGKKKKHQSTGTKAQFFLK